MKAKIITILLLCCFTVQTFSINAATVCNAAPKNAVFSEEAYKLKVDMLRKMSAMTVKELAALSHTKLNFFNRLMLQQAQKKLKRSFDNEGNITNKKLDKFLKKESKDADSKDFHTVGFLLGLFFSWVGVLITYIAYDKSIEKKRSRKWAWIGFGAGILLTLIFVIIIAASFRIT